MKVWVDKQSGELFTVLPLYVVREKNDLEVPCRGWTVALRSEDDHVGYLVYHAERLGLIPKAFFEKIAEYLGDL